jgi:hypothetical protein
MTTKAANAAVATHPAIKPANILTDIFFIIFDFPGRGWNLPERRFQRLRISFWIGLCCLLFRRAARLEVCQHVRVGSSRCHCGRAACCASRAKPAATAAKPAATAATTATATTTATAGTVTAVTKVAKAAATISSGVVSPSIATCGELAVNVRCLAERIIAG